MDRLDQAAAFGCAMPTGPPLSTGRSARGLPIPPPLRASPRNPHSKICQTRIDQLLGCCRKACPWDLLPEPLKAKNQQVPQEKIVGWPHTQKKRTSLEASARIRNCIELDRRRRGKNNGFGAQSAADAAFAKRHTVTQPGRHGRKAWRPKDLPQDRCSGPPRRPADDPAPNKPRPAQIRSKLSLHCAASVRSRLHPKKRLGSVRTEAEIARRTVPSTLSRLDGYD